MNVERLRKIIAYSDKNREEIYSMVKRFCAFARIEYNCNEVIASCVINVSIINNYIIELLCSSSEKGPLQII